VVLPKGTPEVSKVLLTVSTAASDANHKVYYRVVDADPSAMNVGDVIIPPNWTEVSDINAREITATNGKFVEIVEVTTSDNKATRWGKSVAINDNYTAPVAATGMTVVVLPKGTPEASKVMLTVSTAASDANHKVYYRVVDADPSAMNVGDVITPPNWIEVSDTSAHETIVANGKFVEVVEVTTSDNKATRWGKSVAINDNYTAPVVATGMTAVILPKVPASKDRVMLTVSTAASDANHKVYYRVVDADPSAMNVGDVIIPPNWTEVSDINAREITATNGKFVEIVEVTTSDNKATRWGKSVAINDNYTAPVAATGMTVVVLPKGTPEVSKVLLTVSTAASDANHKVYY
ncbi:hypothetical protein LGL05_25665, partial [Clostridium tagluense]|nr:hypothetical protein [Clostridium tagluense]